MKTKIYYKMTMREYYKLAVDKEHKCVVCVCVAGCLRLDANLFIYVDAQ